MKARESSNKRHFFIEHSFIIPNNYTTMPHICYKLQLPYNYSLHNLITTHYHHSHTTETHANTKENTRKYGNKNTEIQIKVELRCPHHKGNEFLSSPYDKFYQDLVTCDVDMDACHVLLG